jgi:hypothetical protein
MSRQEEFMKRFIVTAAAVVFALGLAGCGSGKDGDIEGKWALDLDKTVERARSMGASNRDVDELRKTYEGARMHVKGNELVLSVDGFKGDGIVAPYKKISSDGACRRLKVNLMSQEAEGDFCAKGGTLEVKGLNPMAVEVYRKAS